MATVPYDSQDPALPMGERRVTNYYTVGVQGIPICMGNGTQCLSLTSPTRLPKILPKITVTSFLSFKPLVLKGRR